MNDGFRVAIRGLQKEIESNQARIKHQEEVVSQKDDDTCRVNTAVVASHNEIAMLKADLRKADSEICYVDDQNKRH